jgi:4-alpha-glucanotransferase
MESQGFPWWKHRIEKLTEIFHIFRIDHILGFYRIYAFPWRPQRNHEFIDLSEEQARELCHGRLPGWAWRPDDTDENKRANRDDGDRRLRAIIAAAHGGEIVGEDLGCVPDYVRPHLESLGIAGFRIPHWESRDGHVVPGNELPECSFATYSTHDHDSIAALWQGHHLAATGVSTNDEGEMAGARWNLRMFAEFSGLPAEKELAAFDSDIQWSLIAGLLRCRSRYAAIMVTDLFGMHDRFNRPGTVGGENWRFRLPFTLAEMQHRTDLAEASTRMREVIEATDRC